MNGTALTTSQRSVWALASLAPLALLLGFAVGLCFSSAWQSMWLLALSIFAGLKWLTFATCPTARGTSAGRALGYLLLWPGMNANAFLVAHSRAARPPLGEWALAILKLILGLFLVGTVVPWLGHDRPLLAGWVGLVGLVFVLHFGLFHLLSLGWRLAGIDAPAIMSFPVLATSLSDFWGRRWNLAFRDLAFKYVLRPLAGRLGVAGATMAVFVVSGLVHELVISVPVRGGWGGPTVYFLIQGAGLMLERSALGQRLGLRSGFAGRLFCAACTVAPVGWLFHEPFIRQAILPTLTAIGML